MDNQILSIEQFEKIYDEIQFAVEQTGKIVKTSVLDLSNISKGFKEIEIENYTVCNAFVNKNTHDELIKNGVIQKKNNYFIIQTAYVSISEVINDGEIYLTTSSDQLNEVDGIAGNAVAIIQKV